MYTKIQVTIKGRPNRDGNPASKGHLYNNQIGNILMINYQDDNISNIFKFLKILDYAKTFIIDFHLQMLTANCLFINYAP